VLAGDGRRSEHTLKRSEVTVSLCSLLRWHTPLCANVALLVGAALPVRACARMPAAHVGLSGSGLAISAALPATAAPPAASFVRTQQLSAAVRPHAERSGCFPSNHRASSAPMPPGRSCLCRPVSGRRFRPSSDVRSRVYQHFFALSYARTVYGPYMRLLMAAYRERHSRPPRSRTTPAHSRQAPPHSRRPGRPPGSLSARRRQRRQPPHG
jgi:hypothetical protein